jgi:predicted ribosome quality control (RQC) complex YloA/Tae2 family protein
MKTQISSLDLFYLIKELQFLVGARVDKIYTIKEEETLFSFFMTGKGKFMLRIVLGKFLFLSEQKEKSEEPSGFCMFLRKYLENSYLKEISQVGSDRMVQLTFETKKGEYKVYAELFGKGNIVVTDKKEIILNALSHQKWSDREVKNGLPYSYPKREYDLFSLKKDEFSKLLCDDKQIILTLAKDIGLGGMYAEELCERANIHKKNTSVSKEEKERLFAGFKELVSHRIDAEIIYENSIIKEITPFPLQIFQKNEAKKFPSFNLAFDYFYAQEVSAKHEFKSRHQELIDKENAIVDAQEKQKKNLSKMAEEKNRSGELIYENYQLIEGILKDISKARQKYSFDDIKEKLKGHKIVKDIDGKHKKITIEL